MWWLSWSLLVWRMVISYGHMQVERGGRTLRKWERISAISKLGSEHGDHGWKYLEENNGIETPYEGIDSLKKNGIFTPYHGCVKIWY